MRTRVCLVCGDYGLVYESWCMDWYMDWWVRVRVLNSKNSRVHCRTQVARHCRKDVVSLCCVSCVDVSVSARPVTTLRQCERTVVTSRDDVLRVIVT